MRYRFFITLEVRDFIKALRAVPRRKLEERLRLIHQSPHEFSNYQMDDEVGRPIEIHIFGDLKIHYWIDDPDRDLKIVKIERYRGRQN